jgi:hypothetical protein
MLYIVLIAALVLILLTVYDKRESIAKFFKTKVFKPKPIEIPKPKIDPDTIPNPENIQYGQAEQQQEQQTISNNDSIFSWQEQDEHEEEDIDLDSMFEDMRREELRQTFADTFDEQDSMPDFENMSMEELDQLLEANLKSGTSLTEFQFPSDLTGAELGNAIKNLPPQLKALMLSDVLRRKDEDK